MNTNLLVLRCGAWCGVLLLTQFVMTSFVAAQSPRNREEDQGERRSSKREERRREEQRREEQRKTASSASSSDAGGAARPKAGDSATVQGFGSADKAPPQAPGFNVPLEVPGGNLEDRYDKRVIERAEKETLPRYDRDKDGFLSFDEAKDGKWDPPVVDSDLDKDGRLSRFELYERYAKMMNLPPKTSVVYSAAASGSAAKPAEASSTAKELEQLAEYARGLLNRYDKNKNGVLEKDEWKEMKPEHQAADKDKNGTITLEELSVELAEFGKSSSSSSKVSTSPPASTSSSPASGGSDQQRRKWWTKDGAGGKTEKGDGKKSYRVPTATERLPKGLPDWFARNDTDADGQVMMAEYMTDFTESKATEFAKHDLNGDGVITPRECLEVEDKAKKK